MSRVVLIVGMFRSGTSMVAEVVHRLGYAVAPVIPAPDPPSWRSDWEDPTLTIPLIMDERPSLEWLTSYVEMRRKASSVLGFGGKIAIKSPYLALIWPEMIGIASPAFVIKTFRQEEARKRSLAAHSALSERDDSRISDALEGVQADLEIHYDWAVEGPLRFSRTLAERLEVTDEQTIHAAAALVGRPTEYI